MTRARELQSRNAAAKSIASHNLRNRRPQRKDILEKQKRIRQLDEAILHGDVATLQRLSVTGAGFVNDGIRRRAWPLLLRTIKGRHKEEFEDDKPSKDEEQVRLDVLRSFTHLASDPNVREAVRRKRQDELSEVIIDVLKRHPRLSYYQGFHDVCTCLITVLGKESATLAAECMALVFFRDCMLDNLEPVLDQLSLMMGIFRLEDPEVLEFLNRSDTLPFFALSWVITWCSHDLQDFEKVARVYDFFLCSNPLMPVYFAAAVVMSRREELFEQECDNAMVHTFLTKFPKNCDLELIISHAHQLFETYPPETLQKRTQTWLDDK
ncbi:hypothetical protein DFQ27_007412 [Actinomortierella ambigua]|uniref:Rab-GAP TBC domain-containing protein n=1 Tax=Actinomortierella ambigua TaxID=1343610 RepID=A0A9P6TZQ0_9FUNG|nr:hypothetical protein DFQ27_007412 [Actinomortierella ambigua]